MKCNVCSNKSSLVFEGKILGKYNVKYYLCPVCNHMQTEKPYWLEEAYSTPIAAEDTGILKRNYDNRIIASAVIEGFFNAGAQFLDYGGGWGILTRLMRDDGYDFYLMDKYSENLFARGFDYLQGSETELITAFEVIEHLSDPIQTFDEMFKLSSNVLFSQPYIPDPVPQIGNWWYYAPETGQHISFYGRKTLEYIAQKFRKNYISFNDIHLMSDKTVAQEDFETVIKNSQYIYLTQTQKRRSKITDDMEYLKNC